MADNPAAESAPKRRARRSTTAKRTTRTTRGAATTRRRSAGGSELVDNLNGMVDQLIKENRKLKRQLEKLTSKTATAASGGIERGLKSIQRRVQKALSGATTTRRRTTRTTRAAGAGTRRTTTRRRRTTTTETPST